MNESLVHGWSRYSLRDLIEHHFSGPSPTCEERPISSSEEWGLLKTTAITWAGWNEDAHKVPPRSFWGRESIEVKQGDVLITKAGPRHRVGVVVYVDRTRPHLMVSGKMVGLRPMPSLVLPSILAGSLSTDSVQHYLNARTTGMAESQTNFADAALLDALLEVPPMPEQRRIVEILGNVSQQILGAKRILAKLTSLRHGVLNDLLTRGIGVTGRIRDPEVDFDEFTQSALGLVPRVWEVGKLNSWFADSPRNGYSPLAASSWTGTSMLGLGCIGQEGFTPSQLKNAPPNDPRIARTLLADGDLLMTRANTRDLVGFAGVYRDVGHPCSYPDLMMRLTPRASLSREFLALMLNSNYVRRQVQNLASGTSGSMVKISGQIVRSLMVSVPPIDEQHRILERIRLLQTARNAERAQLAKLVSLRQGLMSDLLTGRVRVPMERET